MYAFIGNNVASIAMVAKRAQEQKNNTRDANVVPHRNTNRAQLCLTSLSRRQAVLSSWYGLSCPTSCK